MHNSMITVPGLAAEALGSFLATSMSRRFGSTNLVEAIQSAARLALDCIGNSDALYHNVASLINGLTESLASKAISSIHQRLPHIPPG
jgi:hypothetical protein